MPYYGRTYKNVSDGPNLKQRWVSAELVEKAIKHKYDDFEFTSRLLIIGISKKVPACHGLTVLNSDNTYKCFHTFTNKNKKEKLSFFYFAGNNSDKLPHPPTTNNSPGEWAALLNEQTELKELFKRTDFTHQLAYQEDELLCVRSFLQTKLVAPVVSTVTVSPSQVATLTANNYGSPSRGGTASNSVPPLPPSFSKTATNNFQEAPHQLLDTLVSFDYGSPARAVTASCNVMPASPSGVQSIQFFKDRIANKIKNLGIDNAKKDKNFIEALFMLRVKYTFFSRITIDSISPQYFYLCKEVDPSHTTSCDTFKITGKILMDGVFCDSCSNRRKLESNKQGKRAKLTSTKPSANRRLGSLDPKELLRVAVDKRVETKALKRKVNRLLEKLDKMQEQEDLVSFDGEDNANKLLEKVMKHISNNQVVACEIIIQSMLELQKVGDIKSSVEERKEFAHSIVRDIVNKSKKMADKDSQVRYLPSTINIAMNAFLQSRKSYEELKEHSLISYPSIRHLQEMKSAFSAKNGENPECYSEFVD